MLAVNVINKHVQLKQVNKVRRADCQVGSAEKEMGFVNISTKPFVPQWHVAIKPVVLQKIIPLSCILKSLQHKYSKNYLHCLYRSWTFQMNAHNYAHMWSTKCCLVMRARLFKYIEAANMGMISTFKSSCFNWSFHEWCNMPRSYSKNVSIDPKPDIKHVSIDPELGIKHIYIYTLNLTSNTYL